MTLSEFVREIKAYYEKSDNTVINKITDYLKDIDESEYARIYNELLRTVPPARQVGVAQIHEAAERLSVKRHAVHDDRIPMQVKCPVCESTFRYLQGVGITREREHIYEFCPTCGFPIYDYLVYQAYGASKDAVMGAYIERLMNEKKQELEKKKRLVS